jgi:hypothetical protein
MSFCPLKSIATTLVFAVGVQPTLPALAVEEPASNQAQLKSITLPPSVPQQALAKASSDQTILSPVGRDIAEQIGVVALIEEIILVKSELKDKPTLALKHMELKQKLLQQVLIASLTVRDATARIDREIADFNRVSGVLQGKRDKAIQTNSMANIFGAGAMNEIGQAGEMKTNEIPGEIVELVAGGIIMTLGGLSLYQQNGAKQRTRTKPNMLAAVLECPTDRDTLYPPIVWNYLNRPPAGAKSIKTRLQILNEEWQKYGTVGPLKNPKSRKRNGALSNTTPGTKVNLDLLADRMNMLSDVKAEIFQLDRDLLELLLNVQNI